MVAKRIIPCLDVKDGRTVKGVNFVGLKDVGDAVELGCRYAQEGADELVYLDISATVEGRKTFTSLVERIAQNINIPFTVGGGIYNGRCSTAARCRCRQNLHQQCCGSQSRHHRPDCSKVWQSVLGACN